VWNRRDLEEDIRDLRTRINERHQTWVVSRERSNPNHASLSPPVLIRVQAATLFRIFQRTEVLHRQLTEVQLVQVQNHKRNHEFESKNHTHTQELIQQSTTAINVILERVESLGASASQWRRNNTLPAEMVHNLQNKPPEASSAPNLLRLPIFLFKVSSFANGLDLTPLRCALLPIAQHPRVL